jgi:hypothetical protein
VKETVMKLPLRSLLAGALAALAVLAPGSPAPALEPPQLFWSEQTAGLAVNGAYTPLVGDFGGPGDLDDVIWYAPGAGAEHLWVSDGDATFTKQSLQPVNGTYEPLVGDFVGGTYEEVLWYGPGGQPDVLWHNLGDGTFASLPVTVNGVYDPVVLDDLAGHDDVIWAPPGGGAGSVWSFENAGSYLTNAVTIPVGTQPLVGHFSAGVCQDVFWYGPGAAADTLWLMTCNGQKGVHPQSVFGTYEPVVQQLTQGGAAVDDILWYRSTGLSTLWHSDGDGTWTASSHDIPIDGTPLPAAGNWGVVHIWDPTGQDAIFWDQVGPGDHVAPLLNTEVPATATPLIGRFTGSNEDIFWYRPGASVDRLMHT